MSANFRQASIPASSYLDIEARTVLTGQPPRRLRVSMLKGFWNGGFAAAGGRSGQILVRAVTLLVDGALKDGDLLSAEGHIAREDFKKWWPSVPAALHPTHDSFIWVWLRPDNGEVDAENPHQATRRELAARIALEDAASHEPLPWPKLFSIPAVRLLCDRATIRSAESMRKLDEVTALGLRPRNKGRGKGNRKTAD